MGNITLSVSDKLHERMRKHPELKWTEIARKAFERKLQEVELVEKIVSKSRFTEKDADVIGHKIKAEIRKRLR
jgi:hypothetical protein